MRTSVDDLRELEDAIFKDDDVPTTAPIAAENELLQRRRGLHFWTVSDEDRRALMNIVWPWPVVCCYVAWQRFDSATAGVASFRKWRGRIWRDPLRDGQQMKMADAEFAVRNALQSGDIKAEAMLGDAVSEIPAGEWPRLKFETNAHGEVIEFDRLLRQGKPRYEEPTLRRADVMKLWRPLDGWAPDFGEIVDIDPADITPVSNPVALITAQASAGVPAEKGAEGAVDASSKPEASLAPGEAARGERSQRKAERQAFVREHMDVLQQSKGKATLLDLVNAEMIRLGREEIVLKTLERDIDDLRHTDVELSTKTI